MADTPVVVGIDLGGTKILSLCVGDGLKVLGEDHRATEAADGPEAVIERLLASFEAAAGGRTVAGVAVSVAGLCDFDHGIVTAAPNLPGWKNLPLAKLIEEKIGLPTAIENDANAAALAEQRLGAGKGVANVILAALGTGIGGGLILDGRLYRGASGAAGEIGHMQLVPEGPLCGCGRRGCLEALAGGLALEAAAKAIVAAAPDGTLGRLARQQGATDARVLELAADAGDAAADAAIRQAGRYLGAGLTNLVNIFNPDLIVIAGSLRKLGPRYVGVAEEVMRREAHKQAVDDVKIVDAVLGDESPAMGVALIAFGRLGADAKIASDLPAGGVS